MIDRILIVDSDNSAAQVTCATLERMFGGVDCDIAADPVQGWIRLQRQPADVVIIDPSRYAQVGDRMIQLIAEAMPQTIVIVLSSAIVPRHRRVPQVAAYLEKNLSPGMLRIKLRALLQSPGGSGGALHLAPAAPDWPTRDPSTR
jgi:DNA-binding response OmpR family regulator